MLKEDGESFVEAQGYCGIGRSGECYHVLISDIKDFNHVAWQMLSKNNVW